MATHASPEVRRAEILNAAQACFGKSGYHDTKMDDIVRATGLSKGALYWHFKSKEEIFLALFEQFETAIFGAWDQLSTGDALDALRLQSEIVLVQLLRDPSLVEIWSEFLKHKSARDRFAKIYETSRAGLQATIQAGIEAGVIAPCDAQHAAASVTAVIEGLLLQALADPSFKPLDVWPTTWQIVSRGLTATR